MPPFDIAFYAVAIFSDASFRYITHYAIFFDSFLLRRFLPFFIRRFISIIAAVSLGFFVIALPFRHYAADAALFC